MGRGFAGIGSRRQESTRLDGRHTPAFLDHRRHVFEIGRPGVPVLHLVLHLVPRVHRTCEDRRRRTRWSARSRAARPGSRGPRRGHRAPRAAPLPTPTLGCFSVPLILIGVGRLPTLKFLERDCAWKLIVCVLRLRSPVPPISASPGVDQKSAGGDQPLVKVEIPDHAFDVRSRSARRGRTGSALPSSSPERSISSALRSPPDM